MSTKNGSTDEPLSLADDKHINSEENAGIDSVDVEDNDLDVVDTIESEMENMKLNQTQTDVSNIDTEMDKPEETDISNEVADSDDNRQEEEDNNDEEESENGEIESGTEIVEEDDSDNSYEEDEEEICGVYEENKSNDSDHGAETENSYEEFESEDELNAREKPNIVFANVVLATVIPSPIVECNIDSLMHFCRKVQYLNPTSYLYGLARQYVSIIKEMVQLSAAAYWYMNTKIKDDTHDFEEIGAHLFNELIFKVPCPPEIRKKFINFFEFTEVSQYSSDQYQKLIRRYVPSLKLLFESVPTSNIRLSCIKSTLQTHHRYFIEETRKLCAVVIELKAFLSYDEDDRYIQHLNEAELDILHFRGNESLGSFRVRVTERIKLLKQTYIDLADLENKLMCCIHDRRDSDKEINHLHSPDITA